MEGIDQSKEYENFENAYYEQLTKILKDSAIYDATMFYIHPDELLYGKTKLNKVKKTKLGKLII